MLRRQNLGGLDCVVTGADDGPVVVLLHGYGASGDDLVPLAREVEAGPLRWVFPAAPLALASGYGDGRAWWEIDLAALEAALSAGVARDRSTEVPPGLASARAQVFALLDALPDALGPRAVRPVLGGFSQGAMLACDVALRSPRALAGLALLSGTLLAAHEWTPLMPARRGLDVFVSHGTHDPLLPFDQAERLCAELRAAGVAIDWAPFSGAHEIPPLVLARLEAFLARVTACALAALV